MDKKCSFSNFFNSFFLFFIIYLFLTFPFDIEEFLTGIFLSIIIVLIFKNFLDYFSLKPPLFLSLFYLFSYILFLLWEILKANLNVAKIVLSPKININSVIVTCKTELKSELGKSILANSITLTPGTLSVEVKDDSLYIHCMDTKITSPEDVYKSIVKPFEDKIKRFSL